MQDIREIFVQKKINSSSEKNSKVLTLYLKSLFEYKVIKLCAFYERCTMSAFLVRLALQYFRKNKSNIANFSPDGSLFGKEEDQK